MSSVLKKADKLNLSLSLSAPCINGWVNNHQAGDLRRHCAHYYVIVMEILDNHMRWDNTENEHMHTEKTWTMQQIPSNP